MQIKAIAFLTVVLAAGLAGCAAPARHEEPVSVTESGLTVQECATQRDSCFAKNPLFGLFTCPGQYAQCLVTASNGIPAQVTAAVRDAADCVDTERLCIQEDPTLAASCTADEAQCLATIANITLPPIVDGTAKCIDDDVACIRAAKSVADLAACADTFRGCAVDQAVSALPPAVGTVVRDVTDCLNTLGMCTADAGSASEITQCGQDEVSCVAGSLGVTLPQPPVADAIHCAETAASCVQKATTAAAVRTCAMNFTQCNAGIATTQLTCAQKWTACLARNPLNFLGCTADFSVCTDG